MNGSFEKNELLFLNELPENQYLIVWLLFLKTIYNRAVNKVCAFFVVAFVVRRRINNRNFVASTRIF